MAGRKLNIKVIYLFLLDSGFATIHLRHEVQIKVTHYL